MIRVAYLLNIMVSFPLGCLASLFPRTFQKIFLNEHETEAHCAIVLLGSFLLSLSLSSLFGLRTPLQFQSILLIPLIFMIFYILRVFLMITLQSFSPNSETLLLSSLFIVWILLILYLTFWRVLLSPQLEILIKEELSSDRGPWVCLFNKFSIKSLVEKIAICYAYV